MRGRHTYNLLHGAVARKRHWPNVPVVMGGASGHHSAPRAGFPSDAPRDTTGRGFPLQTSALRQAAVAESFHLGLVAPAKPRRAGMVAAGEEEGRFAWRSRSLKGALLPV